MIKRRQAELPSKKKHTASIKSRQNLLFLFRKKLLKREFSLFSLNAGAPSGDGHAFQVCLVKNHEWTHSKWL